MQEPSCLHHLHLAQCSSVVYRLSHIYSFPRSLQHVHLTFWYPVFHGERFHWIKKIGLTKCHVYIAESLGLSQWDHGTHHPHITRSFLPQAHLLLVLSFLDLIYLTETRGPTIGICRDILKITIYCDTMSIDHSLSQWRVREMFLHFTPIAQFEVMATVSKISCILRPVYLNTRGEAFEMHLQLKTHNTSMQVSSFVVSLHISWQLHW